MNDLLSNLQPWHLYFTIAILLLGLEMLTNTFDLLWLGLGALAGALVAWFLPEPIWPAMLCAAVAALCLTLAGRKWVRRKLEGSKGFHDPIDLLIGRRGKVVSMISPHEMGIVRVGNETWSAASTEFIATDQEVIVMSRSSTVLHVRRSDTE